MTQEKVLILRPVLCQISTLNKQLFSITWEKWEEHVKLSRVRRFATPWTVACQAPLPLGFSRQEYWSGNMHTNICKIDSQGKLAVRLRELKPGLRDNLEGWEGVGDGARGSRGRGYMYTHS